MPRDDVQLQFLLGSSVRRARKGGTTKRSDGSVRGAKGSAQREPLSLPQSPKQSRTPLSLTLPLSHSSTLDDLKQFATDPRFLSTPRMLTASQLRQNPSSTHFVR